MNAFTVIIPARYGATRLPGKPLLRLAGRPVIEHVWRIALASGAAQVIIATDHEAIAECAGGFGADVCMTAPHHASGTERLAEVVSQRAITDEAIIVNLQGDEPLMPARLLEQVAGTLANSREAAMATLAAPLASPESLHDRDVVKLVTGHEGRALYFSRAPIPWDRQGEGSRPMSAARRHLGIYAYRAGFLKRYASLPASPLEALEALEQLRALQAGVWIQVADAIESPGTGIDTAADLSAAEAALIDRRR